VELNQPSNPTRLALNFRVMMAIHCLILLCIDRLWGNFNNAHSLGQIFLIRSISLVNIYMLFF